MTDLAPERTSFQAEDRQWMRDTHGMTDTIGATLNGDLFLAANFPDGTVPSGTRIGVVTATRLSGPHDPAALDGRQTVTGHLLDSSAVRAGRRLSVALMDHGAVLRNKLPNPMALTAAQITTAEGQLPRIRYSNG